MITKLAWQSSSREEYDSCIVAAAIAADDVKIDSSINTSYHRRERLQQMLPAQQQLATSSLGFAKEASARL
jgi:hypothetical protein